MDFTLTSMQKSILQTEKDIPGTAMHSLCGLYSFSKNISLSEAQVLVRRLTEIFPLLTLRVDEEEGAWLHTHPLELHAEDLSACTEEELFLRLQKLAASPATAFHSDLFLFRYIKLTSGKAGLFIRLHRLIADEKSMALLIHALAALEKDPTLSIPVDNGYFHLQSQTEEQTQKELCTTAAYTWGRLQQTPHRTLLSPLHHRANTSVMHTEKSVDPYLLFAAVCAYRYHLTHACTQTFGMVLDRRSNKERNTFGPFTEELPIVLHMQNDTTLSSLALQIKTEATFLRTTTTQLSTRELRQQIHAEYPLYDTVFSPYMLQKSNCFTPIFSSYCEHGLYIHAAENGSRTDIQMQYLIELYSKGSGDALLRRLLSVLSHADISTNRLSWITPEDVLFYNKFNEKEEHPDPVSPCAYLKRAQNNHPDKIAVISEKESVTLRDLYERSVSVSAFLQDKGITRGSIVGIIMRKSVWLPSLLFGILDSGAAFYLIDTDLPLPQREIAVAQVDFLFADSNLQIKNSYAPEALPKAKVTSAAHCLAGELAYLVETSGVYTKPKTVCISSRSLALRMQWMTASIARDARLLQKEPLRSDACIWELLSPAYGATLVIPPEKLADSHAALASFIRTHEINAVAFMPHALASFVSYLQKENVLFPSIHSFRLFGERLDLSRVKKWKKLWPSAQFINLYGPTECTIDAASYEITGKETVIPLGKPAIGTSIFIVDQNNELLPPGEIGRIMIVGELVGMGYVQAHEGFTVFRGKPAFITEDLGKIESDGLLYYIAKISEWIHTDTHAVCLSKISAAALSIDGIVDAYSFMVDGIPALCYVQDKPIPSLKRRLRALLSSAEMPTLFYSVSKIPHIRSGKADFLKLLKAITPDIENTPASKRESFLYDAVQETFPQLGDLSITDALPFDAFSGVEFLDLWYLLRDHGYYYHMHEMQKASSLRRLAQWPPHKDATMVLRKDSFHTAVLAFPYEGREPETLSETAKLFPMPCTFFAVDTHAISEDLSMEQITDAFVGLVGSYRQVYVIGCGLNTPLAVLCAQKLRTLQKLIIATPPCMRKTQKNTWQKYSDKKLFKLLKKRSDGLFPIRFFSLHAFLCDAELASFSMHHLKPSAETLPLMILTPDPHNKKAKPSAWLDYLGGGEEIYVSGGYYFMETLPLPDDVFAEKKPAVAQNTINIPVS